MPIRTMHKEWIRLISVGGLLGLAAIAPTQGWVTGLTKQEIGNGVQLKIEGTDLSHPHELRVLGGRAYIVEFAASLKGAAKSLTVNAAGVSSAKAVWYHSDPPMVRILVRLKADEHPVLSSCDGGYTISVNVPAKADAPKASAAQAPSQAQVDPMIKQPMPSDPSKAKAAAADAAAAQRVSLDFVNTDVVQILKALALQADVNIVTAPEVSGRKITVSLDHVTVNDALDFVTTLAGLRYAKVQDSYVVTTAESYSSVMARLVDRNPKLNVIRIVPIISGDGEGIKDALSHWFGPTAIQVLLPGEQEQKSLDADKTSSSAGSSTQPQQQPQGAQAPQAANGQPAQPAQPASGSKAGGEKLDKLDTPYLVLIGEEKWVNQAEAIVHKLDEQVIEALSENKMAQLKSKHNEDEIERQFNESMEKTKPEMSQATYMVQNGIALDLKKVIDDSDKTSGVTLVASPPKSTVQTLLLSGPEDQVNATLTKLRTLDTGAGSASEVYTYDIKYADPRSLREDLVANVPGLIVTNPPAAAANPRLYAKGQSFTQQAQTQATTQPTGNGQSGPQSTAQPGVKTGQADFYSPDLPFDDMETTALPMRLILRGSQSQIEDGLKYLAKVDIAPKQIAIEMRVMELSQEDAMNLGIDWSLLTGGTVKTINLNQAGTPIGSNTSVNNTVNLNPRINANNYGSVTATLDALANKNNLISRPNLLCVDGRESEVFVGDDIMYVSSIISSQTGPTVTSADIKVGVRLSVLPRIGGDGDITMDMRPVVSFLKGFNSVSGQGLTLNLPQTSVRIAQSTVSVHSGETLAIGGLIQDQDILNVQKVPLLGDLPILGQLFRSTSHDRKRSEVVFFLTVREVDDNDRKNAADPRPNEKVNKGEMPIPNRKIFP